MIVLILILIGIPFLAGMGAWLKFFGEYHLHGKAELSLNSWHAKLIRFINPDFNFSDFKSFCNYAWFFWLFITFIVPVLVVKGILWSMTKLYSLVWVPTRELANDYCKVLEDDWLTKKIDSLKTGTEWSHFHGRVAQYLRDRDTYMLLSGNFWNYRKRRKFLFKLSEISPEESDLILKQLRTAEQMYKAQLEAERLQAELKQKKKEDTIAKLSKIAKPVMTGSFYISFVIVGYLLIQFGIFLYNFLVYRVDWPATLAAWGKIGTISLQGILGAIMIAIIVVIIYLLSRAVRCSWLQYCIPCEERREKLINFIKRIGFYIAIPFIFLYKVVRFVILTIKNYKSDNCPMITWKN